MLRQLALPWYFEFARLSPQTILPNDEVLLLYLQSFRYSKSLKHLSDKPKCARKPAQKSIVIDRMSLHGMVEQWQWRSCSSKPAVCHFITSRRLVNSISTMRETRYLDRKVWVKSFIQRCIDSCERTIRSRILFLQKAQVWRETIFLYLFFGVVWSLLAEIRWTNSSQTNAKTGEFSDQFVTLLQCLSTKKQSFRVEASIHESNVVKKWHSPGVIWTHTHTHFHSHHCDHCLRLMGSLHYKPCCWKPIPNSIDDYQGSQLLKVKHFILEDLTVCCIHIA